MKFLIVEPSPLPILILLGTKCSHQDPAFNVPPIASPSASLDKPFYVFAYCAFQNLTAIYHQTESIESGYSSKLTINIVILYFFKVNRIQKNK